MQTDSSGAFGFISDFAYKKSSQFVSPGNTSHKKLTLGVFLGL
jgi:hypothetical protein